MNQLAIEFTVDPVEVQTIRLHPDKFAPDFEFWLVNNWPIWRRFVAESRKVFLRGRNHYSARTIVEWMRHETALAQTPADFKINDHYTPDMARLVALIHPELSDLFEFRVQRESSKRAA